MTSTSTHPCPGCLRVTSRPGRCVACGGGTTTQRGYGADWRRRRASQLRAHPVCEWPQCGRPATEVDHIRPKVQGGSDEAANLQSLCAWHHRRKTSTQDRRWGTHVIDAAPRSGAADRRGVGSGPRLRRVRAGIDRDNPVRPGVLCGSCNAREGLSQRRRRGGPHRGYRLPRPARAKGPPTCQLDGEADDGPLRHARPQLWVIVADAELDGASGGMARARASRRWSEANRCPTHRRGRTGGAALGPHRGDRPGSRPRRPRPRRRVPVESATAT